MICCAAAAAAAAAAATKAVVVYRGLRWSTYPPSFIHSFVHAEIIFPPKPGSQRGKTDLEVH
jgi:hypothetical protein